MTPEEVRRLIAEERAHVAANPGAGAAPTTETHPTNRQADPTASSSEAALMERIQALESRLATAATNTPPVAEATPDPTRAALAALEARVARQSSEVETLRTDRDLLQRRAAIYGGEMPRGEQTPTERRNRVIQMLGNRLRANVIAGRTSMPLDAVLEHRLGDVEMARWVRDGGLYKGQRAMNESTFSEGGALVPMEYSSDLIELLRPNSVVRQTGVRVMGRILSSISIPKVTGGSVAGYIDEGNNIAVSGMTVGSIILDPKKLAALVPITNDLLNSTNGQANTLVVQDLVEAFRSAEDFQFLRGVAIGNSPNGVAALLRRDLPAHVLSPGVGLSNTPGRSEVLLTAESLVVNSNTPKTSLRWVMNDATRLTFYYAKASDGSYIYREEMKAGTLMGYPFLVTNQIPSNLVQVAPVAVTGMTELYFGDWGEAIIAESGTYEVEASRDATIKDNAGNMISAYQQDMTIVRAITKNDFALRHSNAFVVVQFNAQTAGN